MKSVKAVIITMSLLLILSSFSSAQDMKMMKHDSIKKDMMMKINKDMHGVAIKGYDPVGYFEDKKAVMGDKMYSYSWMGVTWQFKNESYKEMFVKNPEMYAPLYGGYCAFGASMNHLSAADPTAWTILDGKLYLFTNAGVAKKFNENPQSCIMKANENWHDPSVKKDIGSM